jgi:poly-gamma-glutamate synthesis protein (capsule biosynthesis protein)
LVVGTHPHVLQPAGWISTSHGKTLVLYSLGNALFDQAGLPDTRQSALVLVAIDSHGVRSVQVTPFEIDPTDSRILLPDPQVAAQIRLELALP